MRRLCLRVVVGIGLVALAVPVTVDASTVSPTATVMKTRLAVQQSVVRDQVAGALRTAERRREQSR